MAHAGSEGGEHTMLSALCSQRDRFRERVRQVEEQLAGAHQDHLQLKRDLDSARADNVALVERLRFVQGYQSQQRKRTGATARTLGMSVSRMEALPFDCDGPSGAAAQSELHR